MVAALLLGLLLLPSAAWAPPPMSRDEILCRAGSGVGFSYHRGGGCWCANGCVPDLGCPAGSCTGNCPNCRHSGRYGADCSGFVNNVWQMPDVQDIRHCSHGPRGR